jgi:hypothetical protein
MNDTHKKRAPERARQRGNMVKEETRSKTKCDYLKKVKVNKHLTHLLLVNVISNIDRERMSSHSTVRV